MIRTITAAYFLFCFSCSAHQQIRTNLDEAISVLRSGNAISDTIRTRCSENFKTYTKQLFNEHNVSSNLDLPEKDRIEFYLNCLRASIAIPKEHAGWPTHSSLRMKVWRSLEQESSKRLAAKDSRIDPYKLYGYFGPAHTSGNIHLSVKAFQELQKRDPFLATIAIRSAYRSSLKKTWVEDFYIKRGETLRAENAKQWFLRSCFPRGLQKTTLSDFRNPPSDGVFIGKAFKRAEEGALSQNSIIVALDGYRTKNLEQYEYIRDLDKENPVMDLIYWNKGHYYRKNITADKRIMGVLMENYFP